MYINVVGDSDQEDQDKTQAPNQNREAGTDNMLIYSPRSDDQNMCMYQKNPELP